MHVYIFMPLTIGEDELNGMDTTDGCCVIVDEHFGHLFVLLVAVMFNQPFYN